MKLYVLLLLAGLLNSGFALEIGVWKNYTPDAVEMREADGMLVLRRFAYRKHPIEVALR